ncbi:prepilin peptidase [Geomicrobium sp. JSM 1781026]|uniref:A24 family peptidase n=1 Tax=Geomicrobium sp. JSM 1781026 TaxID=3344580 RepID=UPI0035BEC2DC
MSYAIILIPVLIVATIIDLKHWRIPNWLTVSAAFVGLVHSYIAGDVSSLLNHTTGMIAGVLIFFILYVLGAYGAGDAKLVGAIGAIMGLEFILYACVLIIFLGGITSFLLLLKRKGFMSLRIMMDFLKAIFTRQLGKFHQNIIENKPLTYPFSIIISLGSVITLWVI